jgi:hypothetical protein
MLTQPIGLAALSFGGSLVHVVRVEAQVGITSGVGQVTLIARAPLQGSLEGLAVHPGIGLRGGDQGTITLRISANSGYRLVVRGSGMTPADARIWVRSVSGEFQEVTQGSSVVVADDSQPAAEKERQLEYLRDSSGDPALRLPLQYELQISPAI